MTIFRNSIKYFTVHTVENVERTAQNGKGFRSLPHGATQYQYAFSQVVWRGSTALIANSTQWTRVSAHWTNHMDEIMGCVSEPEQWDAHQNDEDQWRDSQRPTNTQLCPPLPWADEKIRKKIKTSGWIISWQQGRPVITTPATVCALDVCRQHCNIKFRLEEDYSYNRFSWGSADRLLSVQCSIASLSELSAQHHRHAWTLARTMRAVIRISKLMGSN